MIKKRTARASVTTIVIVVFSMCLGATRTLGETLDAVAVIVNDGVITLSEIDARYESFLQQAAEAGVTDLPPKDVVIEQVVERLISESIQLQEAAFHGIVVDDEALTEWIRAFAEERDMELDELRSDLESRGISYRSFRNDVRRQMLLEGIQRQIFVQRVFITQQDIRDFRNSPFFEVMASDQYHVGHILIAAEGSMDSEVVKTAETEAQQIVRELRDGAEFAKMAINHSSASTALEGGDLGWRYAEEIPSLFAELVVEMKVGETSDPIRNSLGFHIVQLMNKQGASTSEAEKSLVRHILIASSTIKTKEEAFEEITEVRKKIVEGADFAELAKEHSEDPGSALAGGEMGWTDGSPPMDPTFATVMVTTEVGEISEVFESQFGWHILEVLDRRTEDLSEEAKDDMALRALHQRRAGEAWQNWLKEIRDEAFVKIVRNPK
ncbi:MAG: molecular chaperone SurA [Gammaproteobacteria bacterium]|nr:molecular chaperone SurA [Gammaproteobacteria bacterium]MYD80354.1 molecular chaperone SurA [Gammaproteobacteria bacterium]